jgi:hypothetical protein
VIVLAPFELPASTEKPQAKLKVVVATRRNGREIVVERTPMAVLALDQAAVDVRGHLDCFVASHVLSVP